MGYRTWNFDIDRLINPVIPPPPWKYLPYPVAWFFGYRTTKATASGNLMPMFWAFLGVFAAIVIIEVVSQHIPSFDHHQTPMIVGSFGAAAVLEFYAIEVPLAQPRNAIGGQLVSALVGVAVAKLFQLSDNFHDIQYLGGALACACATCLMAITKTVHPPAGATALLAVVDDRLVHIGWFLIPVMMLGCGLMLCVALIVNNIQRRFPIYWWTPEDLRKGKSIFRTRKSVENEVEAAQAQLEKPAANGTSSDASRTQDQEASVEEKTIEHHQHDSNELVIRPGQVVAPESMYLTQEEKQFLETLCRRL